MRIIFFCSLIFLLLLPLSFASGASDAQTDAGLLPEWAGRSQVVVADEATGLQFIVEEAPEWTGLFVRDEGWTGADGAYSIPLNGVDAPGTPGRTVFTFGDSWIGEVGPDGKRLPGSTLVNNTLALLPGTAPDPARIRFTEPVDKNGDPRAVFIPNTPESQEGDWYWPTDGVAVDGTVYLFAARMRRPGFTGAGISLIVLEPDGEPPFPEQRQIDTPLFLPATADRGTITFGGAIMANTVEAGAPHPDGYLYIYGIQEDLNKKMLVARVQPASIEDFSAWRYWDGSSWVADIEAAAPVTDRLSAGFSVVPMPDGRYLAVFMLDQIRPYVAVRVGDSPTGPFGPPIKIWHCPEVDVDPDVFVYNALAHPHLSAPGELLINYSVNSLAFSDVWNDAHLYVPRFIRVRFSDS